MTKSYQDVSRQCHLEYPSSIFMRGSVDEDDFLHFSNFGGDASFRIKSLPNEEILTPGKIKAEFVKKTHSILVYDQEKDDFLLLSGFQSENIFYSKIALSEDRKQLYVLHISYPISDKAFDGIVLRMAWSFRAKGSRLSLLKIGG